MARTIPECIVPMSALLLFGVTLTAATCRAGNDLSVHLSWSLHSEPSPSEAVPPVLEDVTGDGQLLIWKQIVSGDAGADALLLWRPGKKKPSAKLALSELSHYESSLPVNLEDFSFFSFRSPARSTRILATEGPWLAVLNFGAHNELGRILPCQHAGRKLLSRSPGAPPDQILIPAINPVTGIIAVACNMGRQPSIVLIDSHLKLKLRRWAVPVAVQDLKWSPNGELLAALLFTPPYPWNKNGKFEGSLADAPPKKPNLLIFDPQNGALIKKFRTGKFDGQIAYSPDGSLIYSISHAKYFGYSRGDWAKEDIRVLDSTTGRLVRTLSVPKTGVRNNFSLSPDGKLIAAQSTVDAWVPWPFSEPGESGTVKAGFVILDSHTGRVIFRTAQRTGGDVRNRIPIFWGPRGRELFVQAGVPIRKYSISSAKH